MTEIKPPDGIWRPRIIGEFLEGEYLEMEPHADNYDRKKYSFSDTGQLKDEEGNSIGVKGRIAVFGSVTLDDLMLRVPIGTTVGIIYEGEKINRGKKRPTKLFSLMSKDRIPEEELGNIDTSGTNSSTPTSTDLSVDDSTARELIRDCVAYLESEGNYSPSQQDIADYAEKLINEGDEPDKKLLDLIMSILAQDLINACITHLEAIESEEVSEENIAKTAKEVINESDTPNRNLLTKVQLILAESVKNKKGDS